MDKKRPSYILPLKRLMLALRTHWREVKEWKKIFHASRNQKRTGVVILISDKINFKSKTVTKDKKSIYR